MWKEEEEAKKMAMKEEERGISLTHGSCDFPNFQTEGSQGQLLTSPHG